MIFTTGKTVKMKSAENDVKTAERFKENKSRAVLIIVVTIIIVALLMVFFVISLRQFVDRSVHNERATYLTAQITTTADILDTTMAQLMGYTKICANIIYRDLHNGDNVHDFLKDIYNDISLEDTQLLLVDENGIWYGTEDNSGRIVDTEYYSNNTEDSLMYVGTDADSSEQCLFYRVRLESPITVVTNKDRTAVISYVAVSYGMDTLYERFMGAFPYECNSFMVDENGLMIFRNMDLGYILEGSNIFAKYEQVEFLYGDSAEEQLECVKSGETAVGEFIAEGTNYFICTSSLQCNGWYVSFVVPSDSLSAGSYVGTLFIYVAAICALFAIVIVVVMIISIRMQNNRKQLAIEQEANKLLENASRAKSDFLSNMSHDIRTPINGIMGMTLLAQKEDNPPKTKECLDKIDSTSKHLLSLVNDVLDMSSIESGKIQITEKPGNILAFYVNCLSIIEADARDHGVNLVEEKGQIDHPYVMMDELHVKQILINILGNAVKFTPSGGTITFAMTEESYDGRRVMIKFVISDTGIGMKPEFLENIWNRFSQEEGGSRTNYKGTGLGMAISKTLTELMKGTINVESVYEEGSTFTVEIPFDVSEAEVRAREEHDKGNIDISGVRVLLVEDNDLNLIIAKELLEDEGVIVYTAVNGKEAVETFESSPPDTFDIILMDIMMPVMNGLEAAEAIRHLDREDAKTIPIAAMTANAFESDIQASYAAGMNGHISKPIELHVVLKTIAALCKKKGGGR